MTQPTPATDADPQPAEIDPCEVCGLPSVKTIPLNITDPKGPADQPLTLRQVAVCEEHRAEFEGLGGQEFFDKYLSSSG